MVFYSLQEGRYRECIYLAYLNSSDLCGLLKNPDLIPIVLASRQQIEHIGIILEVPLLKLALFIDVMLLSVETRNECMDFVCASITVQYVEACRLYTRAGLT